VRRRPLSSRGAVVWTTAAVAAFVASVGVIGGDALWLVPVGDQVAHGHLPSSISYATAPSNGWHDVPAGAELVFWAAYHAFGGERGLIVLQAVAAGVGVAALARGIGRQSPAGAALLTSLLFVAGALPAVGVTNISLFSFALFPVLLGLVQSESARPSRQIWLAVPLLALWGNLHGAVLVGWALLACYLVLDRARRRPAEAGAVLTAATLALFANPALWHTVQYYSSVFHNEAARQGIGLWVPLRTTTLDLLLVSVFALFGALALLAGRKLRLWEVVAVAGLAVATVHVARNGVWALYVIAYPAARAVPLSGPRPRLLLVAAAAVTLGVIAGLARNPPDPGSMQAARTGARTGKPVLAEPVLGQHVALEGGRVWLDNPLDAFRQRDQRLYIDWFSGRASGSEAIGHAGVVLVHADSAAGRRAAADRRLVLLTAQDGAALYRVRRAGSR